MKKTFLLVIALLSASATAQPQPVWEYGLLEVFTRYPSKSQYSIAQVKTFSVYWNANKSQIPAVDELNPNGLPDFMRNLVGNDKLSLLDIDRIVFQNAMAKNGWELVNIDTDFTEYANMYVRTKNYWYKRLVTK